MLGEVTPACAEAVAASRAVKILVPIGRCGVRIAGTGGLALADAIEDALVQALALSADAPGGKA
jgi:hypothetical protein